MYDRYYLLVMYVTIMVTLSCDKEKDIKVSRK